MKIFSGFHRSAYSKAGFEPFIKANQQTMFTLPNQDIFIGFSGRNSKYILIDPNDWIDNESIRTDLSKTSLPIEKARVIKTLLEKVVLLHENEKGNYALPTYHNTAVLYDIKDECVETAYRAAAIDGLLILTGPCALINTHYKADSQNHSIGFELKRRPPDYLRCLVNIEKSILLHDGPQHFSSYQTYSNLANALGIRVSQTDQIGSFSQKTFRSAVDILCITNDHPLDYNPKQGFRIIKKPDEESQTFLGNQTSEQYWAVQILTALLQYPDELVDDNIIQLKPLEQAVFDPTLADPSFEEKKEKALQSGLNLLTNQGYLQKDSRNAYILIRTPPEAEWQKLYTTPPASRKAPSQTGKRSKGGTSNPYALGDVSQRKNVFTDQKTERLSAKLRREMAKNHKRFPLSGCESEEVLTVTLISGSSQEIYSTRNALRLRADLAELWRKHLLSINPETRQVEISPVVLKNESENLEYKEMNGQHIPLGDIDLGGLTEHYGKYQDKLKQTPSSTFF